MKWIYNSIIIFQLVCCCSLVLCWIFLSTFSLNKFHRWDLASESHTKSFIEEVLRWEIDLDGKHFREKPTNQKDLSQFLISGMRRRSSGEVAGKESHDKHFQLLREDRINGGTAWLTFYVNTFSSFCLSGATRNYEQRQKETCTIFGVQHNVLAFLRPTRKNVLKPRAWRRWICWSKTMRSGGKKATDWNKRCNLKQKERKLWSRIRDGNQIQRRMWKQNTNTNKNTNTNTKNKTRGRLIVAVQYTNWSRAGIWDNKVKSVGSHWQLARREIPRFPSIFSFSQVIPNSQLYAFELWLRQGPWHQKLYIFWFPLWLKVPHEIITKRVYILHKNKVLREKWTVAEIRSVCDKCCI